MSVCVGVCDGDCEGEKGVSVLALLLFAFIFNTLLLHYSCFTLTLLCRESVHERESKRRRVCVEEIEEGVCWRRRRVNVKQRKRGRDRARERGRERHTQTEEKRKKRSDCVCFTICMYTYMGWLRLVGSVNL